SYMAYYTAKKFEIIYPHGPNQTIIYERELPYEIHKEMFEGPQYNSMPIYDSNQESTMFDISKEWNQISEANAKMAVFPNGSSIITYPWGGIEMHNNSLDRRRISYFAINNSISAACCAPDNKHVALGSYDGTITIIDITQEETKKQCQAQFED